MAARSVRNKDASEVTVAACLLAYHAGKADTVARPKELSAQLYRLNEHFGALVVDAVTPDVCADFIRARRKHVAAEQQAAAKRTGRTPRHSRDGTRAAGLDLAILRAALRYARDEARIVRDVPKVNVPATGSPRERWLTRSEAAAMIWHAWRYRAKLRNGRPGGPHSRRHIARWLVVARWTGTRSTAICEAAYVPTPGAGWIDLDAGVYYRAADMALPSNKRRPPIRIPDRLLAHLRRWRRMDPEATYVVEWRGKPVTTSIKKGYAAVREAAGIDETATPHAWRHSAITWAVQGGANLWEACGFFGVTREVMERVYAHHHPDHQDTVHEALAQPNVTRKVTRKPDLRVVGGRK